MLTLCPHDPQFNTLMAAAVASGDCPLALQMHQRLRSAGLRPDGLTYTVLIQVGGWSTDFCVAAGLHGAGLAGWKGVLRSLLWCTAVA